MARPVRPSTISVFLVDDHPVVRAGVAMLLRGLDDIRLQGVAASVAAAREAVLRDPPDVMLVDVRLPDGTGIELLREARSRHPSIRGIVFTSFADDEAFFQSVMAGAAGYLVKDASPDELRSAILTVGNGGSLVRPEVLDGLRRRAATLPPENELLSTLTAQERRILGMVTQGMTNREVGLQLSLAEKTVRNYVSNILSKVGVKNRTQLAAYVARTVAAQHNRSA
jgi:two-component system, NarL family, response regulator DevR